MRYWGRGARSFANRGQSDLCDAMEQPMQVDDMAGSAMYDGDQRDHDNGYSVQRRPWFYHRHDKEGPTWEELRASIEVIKHYLKSEREGDGRGTPPDYALLYRQRPKRSDRDPRFRLDCF